MAFTARGTSDYAEGLNHKLYMQSGNLHLLHNPWDRYNASHLLHSEPGQPAEGVQRELLKLVSPG